MSVIKLISANLYNNAKRVMLRKTTFGSVIINNNERYFCSTTLPVRDDSPNVFEVTKENFEAEVLGAKVPIVLDCWASWCGPCVRLTPIITDAVEAQDGKVKLAKLNTDEQPELAQALQIQSLPTVFAIHNGKPVDNFIGLLGEDEVEMFVQRAAALED